MGEGGGKGGRGERREGGEEEEGGRGGRGEGEEGGQGEVGGEKREGLRRESVRGSGLLFVTGEMFVLTSQSGCLFILLWVCVLMSCYEILRSFL